MSSLTASLSWLEIFFIEFIAFCEFNECQFVLIFLSLKYNSSARKPYMKCFLITNSSLNYVSKRLNYQSLITVSVQLFHSDFLGYIELTTKSNQRMFQVWFPLLILFDTFFSSLVRYITFFRIQIHMQYMKNTILSSVKSKTEC